MTTDPAQHPRAETLDRYAAAKRLIPGGTQLLSKRPEMFAPGSWPAYYETAEGVTVTDLDGNRYTDMSYMGIGSCVLGYADPDVNRAVHAAVDAGSMSTLNPPEEVDLAERLIEMHPWASMVRYARSGGEAVAIAVRIARAYTGEETVAFCGYHGWHDWYLAANLPADDRLDGHLLPGLDPAGVPQSLQGTALPFEYNDLDALEQIAADAQLGAIVIEPIRYTEPDAGFLAGVREVATAYDVPLIVDEITAGFRTRPGGYHAQLDLTPDIAVYGKAIANGHPMAAVVGTEAVMDAAQDSFISSTFWTERVGPVAALATIEKFEDEAVHTHLVDVGRRIREGWEAAAAAHDLPMHTKGIDPLPTFVIDHPEGQAARTLFTQEMLARGYLASSAVYVSYAHQSAAVEAYLDSVDEVFETVVAALDAGEVSDHLTGSVAHAKFRRLN
jgi:glutamate-1-semialdehyde aminotransferase